MEMIVQMFKVSEGLEVGDDCFKKTMQEMIKALDYFNSANYDGQGFDEIMSQEVSINLKIIEMNSDRRVNCYDKYLQACENYLEAVKASVLKRPENG
jgi:hypothetical protein